MLYFLASGITDCHDDKICSGGNSVLLSLELIRIIIAISKHYYTSFSNFLLECMQVFYLTSRGIGSIVAKGIAMRRFANEILEHAVEFEELIERSMSKLESIAPETKRAVETIYSNM